MTEDVTKEVKTEVKPEEKVVEQEVVYTAEETRAMEDGWKPKDMFVAEGGDAESQRIHQPRPTAGRALTGGSRRAARLAKAAR